MGSSLSIGTTNWVLVGKAIATTGDTVLTVDNIPAGYSQIHILSNIGANGVEYPQMRFDDDAGGNYNNQKSIFVAGVGGAGLTTTNAVENGISLALADAATHRGMSYGWINQMPPETNYLIMGGGEAAQITTSGRKNHLGKISKITVTLAAQWMTGGSYIAVYGVI